MMEFLGQLILNVGTIVAIGVAISFVMNKVFLEIEKHEVKMAERNGKLLKDVFTNITGEMKGLFAEIKKMEETTPNVVSYDFSKDDFGSLKE